jgi:hypothetical protein
MALIHIDIVHTALFLITISDFCLHRYQASLEKTPEISSTPLIKKVIGELVQLSERVINGKKK